MQQLRTLVVFSSMEHELKELLPLEFDSENLIQPSKFHEVQKVIDSHYDKLIVEKMAGVQRGI